MRDFSINSLFYDPVADRVLDFVGGVDDIRNKVLRVNHTPREYQGVHISMGRRVCVVCCVKGWVFWECE